MNYKKAAIIATVVILLALIAYERVFYNPYENINNAVGKQYIAKGILLCEMYGEDKCTPSKTGYIFKLCKEKKSVQNCIKLGVMAGNKLIDTYSPYVGKKVEIIGTVRSVPIGNGNKGENCERTQIGCYRGDAYVLDPESIREA